MVVSYLPNACIEQTLLHPKQSSYLLSQKSLNSDKPVLAGYDRTELVLLLIANRSTQYTPTNREPSPVAAEWSRDSPTANKAAVHMRLR